MDKFIVFSQKIAHELKKQGYEIIGTGINIKNPKYTVFYFEDTPELRKAVEELTA